MQSGMDYSRSSAIYAEVSFATTFLRSLMAGADIHLQETGFYRRRFYGKMDTAGIMQPVVDYN
jgi:hypothetical protein